MSKRDLPELYEMTDKLVQRYLQTDDINERNDIIADIIKLNEPLMRNNARTYYYRYNMRDFDEDDIYSVLIGSGLLDALKLYDSTRGIYFIHLWREVGERRVKSEVHRIRRKINGANVISGNVDYTNGNGIELLHTIPGETNTESDIILRIELEEAIKDFIEIEPLGAILWYLMESDTNRRKEGILKVLGSDSYGPKERKRVQRVKDKFRKYLIKNKYI